MKFLKAGLVVSLAVLFYAACATTETTNNNASGSANRNSSSPVAAATDNANAAPSSGRPGAISTADAAGLFKANNCVACHGEDGKGNPAMKAKMDDLPDFTDAAWQKKATDAEMTETIKNGHKPMPAYKDKLNDEQIKMLVAYARSFAK
jgi:cbb3-type cytochrome c oxidase subunit III